MSEVNTWTTDNPTIEGHYWIKSFYFDVDIVQVFKRPGHDYLCVVDPAPKTYEKRGFLAVSKLGAEWAGPINKPIDDKGE